MNLMRLFWKGWATRPEGNVKPTAPTSTGDTSTLVLDVTEEERDPDTVVQIDNLDEAGIKTWWINFLNEHSKKHKKFNLYHFNCSNLVSTALDQGGGRKRVINLTEPLIWMPSDVLEDAQWIVKAGSGQVKVPTPNSVPIGVP